MDVAPASVAAASRRRCIPAATSRHECGSLRPLDPVATSADGRVSRGTPTLMRPVQRLDARGQGPDEALCRLTCGVHHSTHPHSARAKLGADANRSTETVANNEVEDGRCDRVIASVDAWTLGAKAPTKRSAGGLAGCIIQRFPDVTLVRNSELTGVARLGKVACGDVEEARRDRVVTSVDAWTLGAKAPTKRFAGGLASLSLQRYPDTELLRNSEMTRVLDSRLSPTTRSKRSARPRCHLSSTLGH